MREYHSTQYLPETERELKYVIDKIDYRDRCK